MKGFQIHLSRLESDAIEIMRYMMALGEFVEVFVDTPLSAAEERDVKGFYAKVGSGQLKKFTGIDRSYDASKAPEINIDTTTISIDEAAEQIVKQSPGIRIAYQLMQC